MKKWIIAVFLAIGSFEIAYAATQFQVLGNVTLSSSTATGGVGLLALTKAQSILATPHVTGAVINCTDCLSALCVSTGTGQGAWVNISSGPYGSPSQPCK